jgi:hypothetical protein
MERDRAEFERTHGVLIRVRFHLTSTEDGGRSRPVLSDYRSTWDIGATYEGKPMQTDARLFLEDVDALLPGEVAVVRIHPNWPSYWSTWSPA